MPCRPSSVSRLGAFFSRISREARRALRQTGGWLSGCAWQLEEAIRSETSSARASYGEDGLVLRSSPTRLNWFPAHGPTITAPPVLHDVRRPQCAEGRSAPSTATIVVRLGRLG